MTYCNLSRQCLYMFMVRWKEIKPNDIKESLMLDDMIPENESRSIGKESLGQKSWSELLSFC